jgi:hypothetical protein
MSRISHFQHYSQPENHATNNTLLVFSYFYRSSPFKLQSVLGALLEKDLSIGLGFEQQIRHDKSVPDALISQEPLRIFIETKTGGPLEPGQICRHLDGIAASTSRSRNDILIGLTRDPISTTERAALTATATSKGVIFTAVTFSQIVENLRAGCESHERELINIVDDYEAYLSSQGLLEQRDQYLVVFPCGTSIKENVRFNLYYEPVARPSKRNYRFIGIYAQKTVSHIGEIEAIGGAAYEGAAVTFNDELGTLTEAHKNRIKDAIEATPYYDLTDEPHRFYLVRTFHDTQVKKTSPGGIMGLRYLEIAKLSKEYKTRHRYDAAELAALLNGATWE